MNYVSHKTLFQHKLNEFHFTMFTAIITPTVNYNTAFFKFMNYFSFNKV